MAGFSGLLDATFLPPRNWTLKKHLTYACDTLTEKDVKMLRDCTVSITDTGKITVPAGYITDLASVPRAAWAFISPFDVAIIPSLKKNDKSIYEKAIKIYNYLKDNKIDVLFDDTDEHLSAKFKKFDLIGIPYQIILGSKSTDNKFEFKDINKRSEILSLEEIKNKLLKKEI